MLYIKSILSYEVRQSILNDILPTKTQSVCIMINVAEKRALTMYRRFYNHIYDHILIDCSYMKEDKTVHTPDNHMELHNCYQSILEDMLKDFKKAINSL